MLVVKSVAQRAATSLTGKRTLPTRKCEPDGIGEPTQPPTIPSDGRFTSMHSFSNADDVFEDGASFGECSPGGPVINVMALIGMP
jgi:hypothetical protein